MKVIIGIKLRWVFCRLAELQYSKRLSTATKVIERLLGCNTKRKKQLNEDNVKRLNKI